MNGVFEWHLEVEHRWALNHLRDDEYLVDDERDHQILVNHHSDENLTDERSITIHEICGRRNNEYYWYHIFRSLLLRIPIFKLFTISSEERGRYYCSARLEDYFDFLVPPTFEQFEIISTPLWPLTQPVHDDDSYQHSFQQACSEEAKISPEYVRQDWKYTLAKMATLF